MEPREFWRIRCRTRELENRSSNIDTFLSTHKGEEKCHDYVKCLELEGGLEAAYYELNLAFNMEDIT